MISILVKKSKKEGQKKKYEIYKNHKRLTILKRLTESKEFTDAFEVDRCKKM